MAKQLDRVKLLSDTVKSLESQRNFPFSDSARAEWEMALNEAKKMLEAERSVKNVRKKM